jgi:hypothetical protein
MGNAKYIGRVGALAVTLGIGAAVTTGLGLGIGVAWADETAPSTDSSPTDPAATEPSAGTPPSASLGGQPNSPGIRRGHKLRPVQAGPNRAALSRPAESSAGKPRGNGTLGESTAADNAATTPRDGDPQPAAGAQEGPAQDSSRRTPRRLPGPTDPEAVQASSEKTKPQTQLHGQLPLLQFPSRPAPLSFCGSLLPRPSTSLCKPR